MQHPFVKSPAAAAIHSKDSLAPQKITLSQEQIDLLARRRGLEALAAWAAECMSMGPREASDYEQGVINAFLQTPVETRLLCRIQTDLERAGKPALSTYAGTIFANAAAEAAADLEDHASRAGAWSSVHGSAHESSQGRLGAPDRRSY